MDEQNTITIDSDWLFNLCNQDGQCMFVKEYADKYEHAFCYGDCSKHEKCPFKNIDMTQPVIITYKNKEI